MSCDHSDTAVGLAEVIDLAHGEVGGPAPFFYMVHPGKVLLEVAIDDPYGFLADVEPIPGTLAIALVTEGWAAPMGGPHDGIRPSRHPDRFRARTTMVVAHGEEAAVLRYAGEPPFTAPVPLGGDMADALRWCWRRWQRSIAAPR